MHKLILGLLVTTLLVACASGNRPLQLVSGAGPVYPPAAQAEGIEGFVTLAYDVSVSGVVENIRVVEAEPPQIFDAAAIKALSSWKFVPAKRDGQAIASEGRVSTISFQLGGSDAYDRY